VKYWWIYKKLKRASFKANKVFDKESFYYKWSSVDEVKISYIRMEYECKILDLLKKLLKDSIYNH
jgi:hypothetical protein